MNNLAPTLVFLTKINELFPLPEAEGFRGHHGITLMDDRLVLQVWIPKVINGTDSCESLSFNLDPEDLLIDANQMALNIKEFWLANQP